MLLIRLSAASAYYLSLLEKHNVDQMIRSEHQFDGVASKLMHSAGELGLSGQIKHKIGKPWIVPQMQDLSQQILKLFFFTFIERKVIRSNARVAT